MLFINESRDGSQIINLTRGDDAVIDIPIENNEGESYAMGDDEYLIFDVRLLPNRDSDLLIDIQSVPGSNRIVIDHAATADLEVGVYSAEVQLMTSDGKRITVWPIPFGSYRTKERLNRKNFVLMPEVVLT